MNTRQALGIAIRRQRGRAGLKQSAVVEALDALDSEDTTKIDQGAISRIERGEQAMTQESLDRMAKALKTKASMLWAEADAILDGFEAEDATAYYLSQLVGVTHVPLISMVEAGNFSEAVDSYSRGRGAEFVKTTAKMGRLGYALKVHGPSMTNPRDDNRSFPEGSIILVNPQMSYESGSLIIARLDDENEATFKQYIEDGPRKVLLPLNPRFPAIPIDRPMKYCGLVVGQAERDLT